jgi:hypothetical protein
MAIAFPPLALKSSASLGSLTIPLKNYGKRAEPGSLNWKHPFS